MLKITIQSENQTFGEVVLGIKGDLNSSTALDLYDTVRVLEGNGFSKFVLNCNELNSISSAGISILIRIRKKFKEQNYALVFIHLNDEIMNLFYFFGFNKTFLIVKDIESAEKLLESLYFYKSGETTEITLSTNRIGVFDKIDSEIENKSLEGQDNKQIDKQENLSIPKYYKINEVVNESNVPEDDHLTEEMEAIDSVSEDEIQEVVSVPIVDQQSRIQDVEDEDEILESLPLDREVLSDSPIPVSKIMDSVPEHPILREEDMWDTEVDLIGEDNDLEEEIEGSEDLEELLKKSKDFEEESIGFSIPLVTKRFEDDIETLKIGIVEEEFDPENRVSFVELVINCTNCGTRIRIIKQGKQKCPTCSSRFLLRQSGSISTIEKLK
jgi:anti-sigma B factor antagonist